MEAQIFISISYEKYIDSDIGNTLYPNWNLNQSFIPLYLSIYYLLFDQSISPFITPVNWLSIVSLIRPNTRNVSISIRDWFYDSDISWLGLSEEYPAPIGDFLSEELSDTQE